MWRAAKGMKGRERNKEEKEREMKDGEGLERRKPLR